MANEETKHSCSSVFVILNGTIALCFGKPNTAGEPGISALTPKVKEHVVVINETQLQPGYYELENVNSSMKQTLVDYDLEDGGILAIDSSKFPRDPHLQPFAELWLPFPDYIIPHRLFNVAFRKTDGSGEIFSAVPGALVLAYSDVSQESSPCIIGPAATIPPIDVDKVPCCFYFAVAPCPGLMHGLHADDIDSFLVHTKHAWRSLARHYQNYSRELFLTAECDMNKDLLDRFGFSDTILEYVGEALIGAYCPQVKADNCKTVIPAT
jgi:hypothetical protein